MLSKLIKYELKSTSSFLLPVHGILILLSVVTRVITSIPYFQENLEILVFFLSAFHIFYLVATMAITAILMVLRFYNNLITDEGYLMHTLPVSKDHLIVSKLIPTIVWVFNSFITVLLSIGITYGTRESVLDAFKDFNRIINLMAEAYHMHPIFIILLFTIFVIAGITQALMMIYCSIACGQLFNNHKLIGSFGAYAVINTLTSTVSVIGIFLFSIIFDNLTYELIINNTVLEYLPLFVLISIILFLIFWSIVFYFATRYLLSRKLNLE